jgi:hypothetical protein
MKNTNPTFPKWCKNEIIGMGLWRLLIWQQRDWSIVVYVGTHLWKDVNVNGDTLDVRKGEM